MPSALTRRSSVWLASSRMLIRRMNFRQLECVAVSQDQNLIFALYKLRPPTSHVDAPASRSLILVATGFFLISRCARRL